MFARRLKKLRLGMNLTQKELGEILQTTRSTIAGYESTSKRRMPNAKRLKMMANLFNVSTDYLLCRDREDVSDYNYSFKESGTVLNLPAHNNRAEAVTIEDDNYAQLGLLKGDVLICKPTTYVYPGALVITKPQAATREYTSAVPNLVYIKKIENKELEIYNPIGERSYIISKNLLKAVIFQVIHCTPSLPKYRRIKKAQLG
ncbi:MAG TPA: helix-turn-helix transcriptional regulator [Clostridia bacterium]|nr:helix-turn-helix transcriptional regulator [Clostridia bacterium]